MQRPRNVSVFSTCKGYQQWVTPHTLILEEIEARHRQLELSAAIGTGGGVDAFAVNEDIQNMMLFVSSPDFPGTEDEIFAPVNSDL